MSLSAPARQRRLAFAIGGGTTLFATYWVFFSSGVPVWGAPKASSTDIAAGQELFEHQWTANDPLAKHDGLGPVFNATSCVACHFQGGVGGGGSMSHNATHFEVMPAPGVSAEWKAGTLHKFSVKKEERETFRGLKKQFPTVSVSVPVPPSGGHCGYSPPPVPFDPVRSDSVQSTAMFGAGWIDRISEKAIVYNHRRRAVKSVAAEFGVDFGGVPVGRLRTLADGRVGRFGWKANHASVKDFVAAACADEIGLGTPHKPQSTSFTRPSAAAEATPDLSHDQFDQMVSFVKTLPRPEQVTPSDGQAAHAAADGQKLFASVGCATCHVPDLGGVRGVYTDFLLYTVDDLPPPGLPGSGGPYGPDPLPEFPRPDDEPRAAEWKTPALWGVADSAPYMHDGESATLEDAIKRHQGDAKGVTAKFNALSPREQADVVAFLKTLKAPTSAPAVKDMSVTDLRRKA